MPTLPEKVNLEQFLFLVQEIFPAVLLTDAAGRITWINQGVIKLCGYELPEVMGLPAQSLFRKCLNDEVTQAYVKDCLAHSQPFQYEVPNPGPNSEDNWIRVKAHPMLDHEGRVTLYAGLMEDITDWKKAQLTLAESEQRFRTLIENAPGVMYEWRENFDGTSQFTYSSPKLQELFGISCDDAGQVARFIHPEDKARWRQTVADSVRMRTPWHFEGRIVVPDQPLRWWRGDAIIAAEDQHGLLYRGILQDITATMVALEAARETEQRWRAAMESVGNDTWEYNCLTHELLLSEKYRFLLGYQGQPVSVEADAEPWYDNVHPDDKVAARQAILAYLRGIVPTYSTTYRVTDQDGQDKWILSRAMVTRRDEQHNPLLVTGTHTDVTEITRTQRALEASTLRLSSTIANLQRAVLMEDENRKIILVNEAFCKLFKLPSTPEELMGTDRLLLAKQVKLHFHDQESFLRGTIETPQQQRTIRGEELALKDGRTIERDSTPIYAQGSYIGYLWMYEDITVRKTAEDALRRREEKYRGILENLNLGLLEMNLAGEVLFVNDSYCEITGYTQQELLHSNLDRIMPNEADRLLLEEKRKLRALGISDTYEVSLKTKRGEIKWVLVSGAPLYDDDKQLVGTIGVTLDITHQKQLEVNLRQAKRYAEESASAKERFLANMSHEIRTPMNAILGMSQLLAKTSLSGPQRNYLHAISSSAENLLVIINDILDLTKINAGKMTLEQIGFNLRKVCEQVEKTLQYKAEDKGLGLIVEIGAGIPDVLLGDPHRLIQVLLNLAGNAIKFTEKGQIWISCELMTTFKKQVLIEFSVSDTGVGIDPKYLKNLFQDFSQEDPSVSRKFGGTGLGLSISRSLVNLMGGELRIESEQQHGTISTFSLLLPIGAETDLPRKTLPISSNRVREKLRGKRILLVEDNEYNRMLAKSFLQHAHMEVTEAENGAVAVALARSQEFDLILMDVQMPVLNGYEATAQLREELALRTPIIALTANAIRGDDQKCLAAGMNDYLAKPFHEDELLKLVHDWLLVAPAPEPEARLYRIDILKEAAHGDDKFVSFMLRTFIQSSTLVLTSLRESLLTGELSGLKAAAHKVKPSLTHLRIYPVLTLVEQLEQWPGAFDRPMLEQLVDDIETELRKVLAQINTDLQALDADPAQDK
ncbi:PAS domain S-box protein [Hymenobacter fastidiosus]